ncbi:uncharacterized protein LOC128742730 [Sabethes cyaneus]|uniref:uncharacterized protein LOC128742730 n=1 Tax=Sabethes cyaneus TaxID=53552 RepID=UPI00237E7625|nr:uncharacterized protein LOC128742730 [Sabethes cyaneus]
MYHQIVKDIEMEESTTPIKVEESASIKVEEVIINDALPYSEGELSVAGPSVLVKQEPGPDSVDAIEDRLPVASTAADDETAACSSSVLMDTTTQNRLKELIGLYQQVNHRLDLIEQRTADITIQNELILDEVRKLNSRLNDSRHHPEMNGSRKSTGEPWDFCFSPVEREEELADLELNLADDDYKSKMVKWLRVHCSDNCADNRMLRVLDLLISKEMQTKCTWTGASRKGPKIAIMPYRNMLQLFIEVGSDDTEVVTQQKLTSFFMRKLKNSLKRLAATGERRGTRHVRRKKTDNEVVEG